MVFQDYPKYMKWKIIQIFETNQIIIYLYLTIIPLLTISSHYIPYKLLLLSPMFFSSPVMAKKSDQAATARFASFAVSVPLPGRITLLARPDLGGLPGGLPWSSTANGNV